MRRLVVFGIPAVLLAALLTLLLAGCASAPGDQGDQAQAADEHPFDYYFPNANFLKTFATVDEAYSYVTGAQAIFGRSILKQHAQGLAAKLVGPAIEGDQPVSVYCFLTAGNIGSQVDLSKAEGTVLVDELKKAASAAAIFLVFYQDRSVSISSFYIAPGYHFNSNSQYRTFHVRKTEYKADYPMGWGAKSAFSYLRHETD